MEFPFHIHSALAQKGEIKMKSMNFFGDSTSKETTKPKKKTYTEDFKKKAIKLAFKIGVTKAAEELGVSTSSLYSWKKTSAKKSLAKKLSSAPIQDENGNLTFELEGKVYSLNVNFAEERGKVKKEVNVNSSDQYDWFYDWFKEETGEKHWVLYNTEIYEIYYDDINDKNYLHYKYDSNSIPVIPINAISCHMMFSKCKSFIRLNLSNFDTSNVIDMSFMFCECENLTSLDLSNFDTGNVTDMHAMFWECNSLTQLDLSSFDTSQVTTMSGMFSYCESLTQLDLSSFNTSSVIRMSYMFAHCNELITIYISDKWKTNRVRDDAYMFKECCSLPGFSLEKTGIKMAKPTEYGGYLTLKK